MARRLPAFVAAASGLMLYWATSYPAPDWLDGPELAATSFRLGIFHPPGAPLAVMLGHLCTLWPFGSPAGCFPLLSAVFASASLYVLARSIDDIFSLAGPSSRPVRHGGTLLLTAAFATACGPWSQAVRYEVYTLALWLFLMSLRCMCRLALAPRAAGEPGLERAMFFAGMCAAVHPLVAVGALAAAVPLAGASIREPRRLLRSFTWLALGAAPLLLLPWMVRAPLDLRWGDPGSPGGWLSFVLGTTFAPTFASAPSTAATAGGHTLVALVGGLGAPLVIASLLGWYLAARTRGRLALVLLAALGANLATLVLQRSVRIDNPDVIGYALPAMAVLLVVAAYGLAATGHVLERTPRTHRIGRWAVAGLLGFLLLAHAIWAVRPLDRGGCRAGRAMAARALACLPHGAVVLLGDFNLVFMFDYLQQVEGLRSGVRIVYLRDLLNRPLRRALAGELARLEPVLPHTTRLDRAALAPAAKLRPVAVDTGPHLDVRGMQPSRACGPLWLVGGKDAATEQSLVDAQKWFFSDLAPPACAGGSIDPRTAGVVAWHALWQSRAAARLDMRRLAGLLLSVATCAAPDDLTVADTARDQGLRATCHRGGLPPPAVEPPSGPRPSPVPALVLLLGLATWSLSLSTGQPTTRRLLVCLGGFCLLALAVVLA